ncbi:dTMP kinase [Angelakisella massiliensis]|uniref:dTMP kinase n=1 Tax=Angelakisella massiliensis TaxID=1871018 RepID=UPI0008F84DE8|nr:thymidylate kinase [Angelakisella massiliensis]
MGKLIVIEGLDGSGKATQTGLLCQALEREGKEPRRITFPDYDSPSSALVKMYLSGELGGVDEVGAYGASLFYTVDRYASYLKNWKRDYQAGGLILSDRYATSNIPHQMSKLPRDQWDDYLRWLRELEYERVGLPAPDLVVYLDMDPNTSRRLLSKRYQGDESRRDIHEKNLEYLFHCREAALYGGEKEGWRIIRCCDGSDPYPPEEIHRQVLAAVRPVLG